MVKAEGLQRNDPASTKLHEAEIESRTGGGHE